MARLRIPLEFSRTNKDEVRLYYRLKKHSNPGAYIKDALLGLVPIPSQSIILDVEEDLTDTQQNRLRIPLEFSETNKDEVELYYSLKKHSNPGAYIKDVLLGLVPIPSKMVFPDIEEDLIGTQQKNTLIQGIDN